LQGLKNAHTVMSTLVHSAHAKLHPINTHDDTHRETHTNSARQRIQSNRGRLPFEVEWCSWPPHPPPSASTRTTTTWFCDITDTTMRTHNDRASHKTRCEW
jgi:hypothetical protein